MIFFTSMSEFIDGADEMKACLETIPSLAGVDVITDRQNDLVSQIQISTAKASGAVVTILWIGGPTDDPDGEPNIKSRYVISVRTKPILRGEAAKADVLARDIFKKLWHWRNAAGEEFKLLDIDMMPDDLLVYQIIAEVRTEIL